jgi:4-diphosphocytidyl-2-C-methyl-D-erythritol kinase
MRTPTQALSLRAYAKVNLGLRVVGRRPDGYHEIDTVLQSIDLCDHITLSPRRDCEISLEMTPDFGIPSEENLALRAARPLKEKSKLPGGVHIVLDKKIPVGAGLGGGSSDAAAVLAGLNRLFELGLDMEALMELGAGLGSDVPFFLLGGRCRARGRGERLEKLFVSDAELSDIYVLFVPPFSLSAREVYGAFDRLQPKALDSPYPNDLEGSALALQPELSAYREFLKGARVPFGLSGSGPTYFAVLDDERDAERLAQEAAHKLASTTQICRPTQVGYRLLSEGEPQRDEDRD